MEHFGDDQHMLPNSSLPIQHYGKVVIIICHKHKDGEFITPYQA